MSQFDPDIYRRDEKCGNLKIENPLPGVGKTKRLNLQTFNLQT